MLVPGTPSKRKVEATAPSAPGSSQTLVGEKALCQGTARGGMDQASRCNGSGSMQASLSPCPCWRLCPLVSDGDMGYQQQSGIPEGGRSGGPDEENQNGCGRQLPGGAALDGPHMLNLGVCTMARGSGYTDRS